MPVVRGVKDDMIKAFYRVILGFGCAAALASCAGTPPIGQAANIEVTDLEELPKPKSSTEFTVGPQDSLEIIVTDSELLSGSFLTDGAGYISYPLVGDLYVAEKTPRQIAKMIEDRLRGEYVVNPQVRVRPANAVQPSISIGGQVTKPGTYSAATSQSLLRAINNAGGLAENAKKDDVLVMRIVDGQHYIGVYNIQAIQRGNYPDPVIFANDIVTVGDSPGRRQLETILGFIPLLSTSTILIDRTFN